MNEWVTADALAVLAACPGQRPSSAPQAAIISAWNRQT